MTIQPNAVVKLHYQLRLNNAQGDEVESDNLVFLFGHNQLLEDFETNINGKKAGDNFAFGIVSERAYGVIDPEAIVDLSRAEFEGFDDVLFVGSTIPMRTEDGHALYGTIREITDETVIVDFNHPMAGKDLWFSGEILEIREATQSELEHGHVHGDGGVHH